MAKTIVTHKNPDLDAITAMWLLIRFDQSRYGDAHLEFVPAGETYKNQPVDTDPDVIHVDNGKGKFDHHSPGGYETCAAKLVYEHLVSEGLASPSDRAIKEMVAFTLDIDRFVDFGWTEPFATRHSYTLHEVIPALHSLQVMDNEAVARYVFVYLDGVYQRLKQLHEAQDEIVQGTSFEWTRGKGLAISSTNNEVVKTAQKSGYLLVIQQHPEKGHMRIKVVPDHGIDLTALYDKIVQIDQPDQWFLHPSKQMLINGWDKAGFKKPTSLALAEVTKLVKEIM